MRTGNFATGMFGLFNLVDTGGCRLVDTPVLFLPFLSSGRTHGAWAALGKTLSLAILAMLERCYFEETRDERRPGDGLE